jgi:hypothetical protein
MPFIDPTTTRTCFHTFCRDCIIRAIAHVPQCPVDRSPLGVDDLTPANPIVRAVSPHTPPCDRPLIREFLVRQLVDELVVECPYRSSGCTITCQRQLLTTHLKDACPYTRTSDSGHDSDQNEQDHQDDHTSAETKVRLGCSSRILLTTILQRVRRPLALHVHCQLGLLQLSTQLHVPRPSCLVHTSFMDVNGRALASILLQPILHLVHMRASKTSFR